MKLLAALLLMVAGAAAQPVPIGYFGPADPQHPQGGSIWQGAVLAIEEANEQGGYNGRPFRLVQRWDENPWSGGAAVVIKMAYEDRVWAIVGGIDGVSTHLAEQVVAKARLALVDPASTDRSVNAAFVPWMFSLMPDDQALMEALANAVGDRFVLVSATDHDTRITTREFLKAIGTRRPQRHVEFAGGSAEISEIARQVADLAPAEVVLLAGIEDSSTMLLALRTAGCEAPVFGGPSMGRKAFFELTGEATSNVRFAAPKHPSDDARLSDYAAAYAYDAVRLVVDAIRTAGEDRDAIRDAIREAVPWDSAGRNRATVELGSW